MYPLFKEKNTFHFLQVCQLRERSVPAGNWPPADVDRQRRPDDGAAPVGGRHPPRGHPRPNAPNGDAPQGRRRLPPVALGPSVK